MLSTRRMSKSSRQAAAPVTVTVTVTQPAPLMTLREQLDQFRGSLTRLRPAKAVNKSVTVKFV